MSATGIHISISAEKLFQVGGLTVSNSIFTSLIVSALILAFAFAVNKQLKSTGKPTGLQNFAEFIIEALHNLIYSVTGDLKRTRLFFPLIASFFLFVLLNNWFGLLPGVGTIYKFVEPTPAVEETINEEHGAVLVPQAQAQGEEHEVVSAQDEHTVVDDHSETTEIEATAADLAIEEPALETDEHAATTEEHATEAHEGPEKVPLFRAATADLNTTIALAIISVVATQIFGIRYLGGGYFKKYINFSSPIMFFVGLLESVLELAKIMSFAFRLFGNIFAGEVLLTVIAFLLPVVAPMPFYGLELFVGFVQALVFSMLSLVFFNMATISHDEH